MSKGTLFSLPRVTPFNAGSAMPGAKLYFFQTGTTTDQAVYTTAACSSAHSQPVVADADGEFAAIYLDPDESVEYTVRLDDSDDNTIWTENTIQRIDENFETDTFTVTWVGFSADPANTTATWYRMGRLIMLEIPIGTGTSNATGFSLTGVPTAIQPATTQYANLPYATDNGSVVAGGCVAQVSTSGAITFSLAGAAFGSTTWTASSTKGLTTTGTIMYRLVNT